MRLCGCGSYEYLSAESPALDYMNVMYVVFTAELIYHPFPLPPARLDLYPNLIVDLFYFIFFFSRREKFENWFETPVNECTVSDSEWHYSGH